MKLLLIFVFVICTGRSSSEEEQYHANFFEVAEEDYLPVVRIDKKDPPSNGVCYKDSKGKCNTPGERVKYRGPPKDCIFCFCNDNLEVVCCEAEAFPIAKKPDKCKITPGNGNGKCKFKRSPRCKDLCSIIGWYYSDLSMAISVPIQDA